jgi:protein-S-isoprenylcysteine O-methyltransferase Ste14
VLENSTETRNTASAKCVGESAPHADNVVRPKDHEGSQNAAVETFSRRAFIFYGFFFKIRGLLAALLLVAMFFTTYGEANNGVALWVIGLLLFGAGIALRIRSQQYLRYRLADDTSLAVAGPYTYTYMRNPVYVANTIGLAGLCILCRLYWMTPIAVVWLAIVYNLVVRFEEMRLLKRFGEPYRQYCQSAPRWIPRRWPSMTTTDNKASVWRAARVEWQNLVLILVPLGKDFLFRSHAGNFRALLAQAGATVAAHR